MSEESKTSQDVLKWTLCDDSMKQGIKMSDGCELHGWITPPECPRCIMMERDDMKELIAAAAEHDDPKRVLREFIEARPELFGERKP